MFALKTCLLDYSSSVTGITYLHTVMCLIAKLQMAVKHNVNITNLWLPGWNIVVTAQWLQLNAGHGEIHDKLLTSLNLCKISWQKNTEWAGIHSFYFQDNTEKPYRHSDKNTQYISTAVFVEHDTVVLKLWGRYSQWGGWVHSNVPASYIGGKRQIWGLVKHQQYFLT